MQQIRRRQHQAVQGHRGSVHTNSNNPYGVQLRDKLRNSGFGLILGTILVALSFTV